MTEHETISIDLERSLFAGAIADPTTLDEICEITTGIEFVDRNIGEAFDLIADLYAAKVPVGNMKVLIAELRKSGLMEPLGGTAGVGKLATAAASASSVTYHAREINRLWRLRRLRTLANEISDRADDPKADPAEIASLMDSQAASIGSSQATTLVTLSESMDRLADKLDEDRLTDSVGGVATGFPSVDLLTGGMFGGDLIVLAARTSIGKTACGMQIGLSAAESGWSTLVCSLEMRELQLAQRIASSKVGLSLVDQRTGNHTSHDSERIRSYAIECRDVPLSIFPARRATVARLRGMSKAMNARRQLDLVIVDYLQLLESSDRRKSRYEQVTQISNDLKTMAMELDVPVLALAQLNRQGEANESPKLSHLRESGAIEQDADSVWFLHRGRDSRDTQFIIEKQRQGPRGTIAMTFDGDRCEFEESPIEDYENYESEFSEWS